MRSRPDLIVPIRDRRQHKRYLTLRNAGWVALSVVLVFTAINIWSEIRPRVAPGYGRLFDRALPAVEQKPVEVVQEAVPPPETETRTVPMQIVDTNAPAPLDAPAIPAWTFEDQAVPVATRGAVTGSDSRVAIVGGPEGVTIVRTTRRKPVLSGGFGR